MVDSIERRRARFSRLIHLDGGIGSALIPAALVRTFGDRSPTMSRQKGVLMTWGRLFGNPVAVLAVVVVALAIFAPNLLAQIFTQAVVGIAGAVTPLIGCIFLFGIFALIARGLFTGKWK